LITAKVDAMIQWKQCHNCWTGPFLVSSKKLRFFVSNKRSLVD